MKIAKLIIISLFFTNFALGQKYLGYSNDSSKIKSNYLNESINLKLHIPENIELCCKIDKLSNHNNFLIVNTKEHILK